MSAIAAFIQELEQEAQTTRRVLERIPEDRLTWKPHEKSMTLGQLALHVAFVPGAIAEMTRRSPTQVPNFIQPAATSRAEVISSFEQSMSKALEILRGMDDAELGKMWRLVDGEKEIIALPVGAILRSLMLNHWYHHRGQLSVYLRAVGVPLPSIYGPSADENPFSQQPASAVSV